jgi:hypothetical protein
MSKAVKTVIGIAAAIAIPFAAPAIASSIGMSAAIGTAVGSATAGSVIGGAITGAALGAAKGAILGEDVGRSALMGGLGGGIGGYTAAPTAGAAGGAAGGTGVTAPTAAAGGSPYALGGTGSGVGLTMPGTATAGTAATGLGGAMAPVDYSLGAGLQFGSMGVNPATAGIGLQAPDPGFFASSVDRALAAGTPIDYSLAAGMPSSTGIQVASANPFTGGTQVTTGAGTFQSTTPMAAYSGGSYSPSLAATAPAAAPTAATASTAPAAAGGAPTVAGGAKPATFTEALKQVPGELAAKFSDPKALADLTLRAAGQLAGSAIAGDGLSSEERALLAAQTEELQTLRQNNQSLFNQRLEQAQALIGDSKYFDPEYFGLQRARRAQVAGARAKRAGLRGLTGESRAAEARRFDLATGRDTGTAYDQGYGTGVQGRLQTMQAGLSAMPTAFPSSSSEFQNIRNAYTGARNQARQTQQDIGTMFGSLTGRS